MRFTTAIETWAKENETKQWVKRAVKFYWKGKTDYRHDWCIHTRRYVMQWLKIFALADEIQFLDETMIWETSF